MKELGAVVNDILARRDEQVHDIGCPCCKDKDSFDGEEGRKIYAKKDLKKFRAAGKVEAGVNDLGLASTENSKAKTNLPDFNPADLGYPVKTVPIKLN